ncbi:MAG: hypothetical protein KDD22_08165 [Bdellovibrionales bacterium]|nr:hypothetical protein [Bdellovibrionales bacterium]
MFRIFYIFLILTLSTVASANEKSEPFFLAITGRVCDEAGKCLRYHGDSGNFQIDLNDGDSKGKNGDMTISYEIEGVTVTNSFNLSVRDFNGSPQTELYIEIKNSTDVSSATGLSVITRSLTELNYFSQNGVAFEANGYKIIPELIVSPAVK